MLQLLKLFQLVCFRNYNSTRLFFFPFNYNIPVFFVQPLLEKLQPLIKEEGIGHVETAGKTEGQTCETNLNIYDDNSQTEEKYASYDLGDLKDAHINFDPEVVQIKAGKAEVSDLPKLINK